MSIIGTANSQLIDGKDAEIAPFTYYTADMAGIQVLKYSQPQLCEKLGGCPTQSGNVTFIASVKLSKFVPFVDVDIRAVLLDTNERGYGCFLLSRDQTDQPYFHILVIVVFCTILLSVAMAAVGYYLGESSNIFVFSSRFGADGENQLLQYPGFFDMVYYLQFVVVTSLLNLDYPYFFQSFIASFHSIMFVLGDSVTNHAARKSRGLADVPAPPVSPDQHGLEFFAHNIGLEGADLFVSILILMAMVLLCVLVLSIVLSVVGSVLKARADGSPYSRKKQIAFVAGNILRVILLFHLPLTIFGFYQFYIHETAWVTGVAAAVVAIFSLGVIGAILGHMSRIAPRSIIFIDAFYMLLYGPLYNNYTSETSRFAFVDVGYRLILALIIAFGQKSGLAQLIILLCLEVASFYSLIGIHPWISLPVNRWEISRQALKIVFVSLLFAFLPNINASKSAKDWCGLILIFLFLLFQLVWVIKILCNIGLMFMKKYHLRHEHAFKPDLNRVPKKTATPSVRSGNLPPRAEASVSLDYTHDRPYFPGHKPDNYSESLPETAQLSPYEKYMASLRENAGLRDSFAMEDSNGNRPYAYQESEMSRSSFALDEYPAREPTPQHTRPAKLPKFFSAKNNE
ncbi:hypothetical protein K493DRAFT_357708 [Basidiobolus meristosporus CBS 931.73]|uniref:TRP C-terminal domain-containing protein n=1 Tax=Basidiobolus meristosporus CBS 931.73 TaxID=1314790 RepID=A0A1Y1XVH8_9FUNG|nr:hypothetical protein K493DRAFT_357708 [Basidiobolus meristosporus CBS 931.73]|eukprot:ORX89761.1 hypothetical protein K493DRAFT_357708 [Basidiobolus meristosporus CBS 931.73]